jgi:KaiC/GvpD/RAD55 family RecA-like ATPase
VSQREARPFELDGDLPFGPLDPGTNLLVTGPAMGRARQFALELVFAGADHGEGMVVVSANHSEKRVLRAFEDGGRDHEQSPLAVVDCTGQGGDGRTVGRPVSSPGDLTGIGIEFARSHEAFAGDGVSRVRTVLDSLSTLAMYTDGRTLFRFVHVLTGRVSGMDGLGVYLLDSSGTDERVVSTISQLCDARVDVRVSDDGRDELRTRGLDDAPRQWTPFALGD